MRQPADDSTVHWLISHQSPCLNDDGPEGRQVVCPGVSLISMSILDFSLFSEVNPSICYMKQLFFVRQQRIGRSRSRPCVWPGCFGCSDTHRKLGPEPQSEKPEDVLMSYPSICSAWTEDTWYQEVALFLSNADEKFDHICCTYTHGTYQRIRSGFFVYGVHA